MKEPLISSIREILEVIQAKENNLMRDLRRTNLTERTIRTAIPYMEQLELITRTPKNNGYYYNITEEGLRFLVTLRKYIPEKGITD